MRIIFDRSAFHGENFNALVNSPLLQAIASEQITVLHTQIFLDETISAYGSRKPVDWQGHLKFSTDICNGGIFLDKEDIWHGELVRDQGPGAAHLHPKDSSRHYTSLPRLLHTLRNLAQSGDLKDEWVASARERQDAQPQKTNQLGIFRELREGIAKAKKRGRVREKLREYPFSEFLESVFISTGNRFMSIVDETRSAELAAQWAQNPARYPFYSEFIRGSLYSAYYAMIEQDRRIDRNAQADYEQLGYLLWADVIVSNDEKFMRSAFETLWAPRGKRMESAQSIAALLQNV